MSLTAITYAFLLPSLSMAALYFGFVKARSLGWLATAAAIWGSFGGYSAWLAVTGSA
jgi:hypothetical protein